MRKNSWVSLTLLFVTYFTFGWKLSAFEVPIHVAWILSLAAVFVLAFLLSFPMKDTKTLIRHWFKTDTGAFLSIILSAFLAVIVVTWLHIVALALLLTSAGALARLEIQLSGLNKWNACGVLAAVSMTGLGLGGTLEYLLKNGRIVAPQLL
jgi:FtsH-binding integral membrane protein